MKQPKACTNTGPQGPSFRSPARPGGRADGVSKALASPQPAAVKQGCAGYAAGPKATAPPCRAGQRTEAGAGQGRLNLLLHVLLALGLGQGLSHCAVHGCWSPGRCCSTSPCRRRCLPPLLPGCVQLCSAASSERQSRTKTQFRAQSCRVAARAQGQKRVAAGGLGGRWACCSCKPELSVMARASLRAGAACEVLPMLPAGALPPSRPPGSHNAGLRSQHNLRNTVIQAGSRTAPSLARCPSQLLPPAEAAGMASLARSVTQNVPQLSACQRQQRAVPAAAAVRLQRRPSQQQRRRSLVVRAQELEEIDPITGEVIAGTAMATEAGQRVEAGEQVGRRSRCCIGGVGHGLQHSPCMPALYG